MILKLEFKRCVSVQSSVSFQSTRLSVFFIEKLALIHEAKFDKNLDIFWSFLFHKNWLYLS